MYIINPETEEEELSRELVFMLHYEDNSTEELVQKVTTIHRPLMDNELELKYMADANKAMITLTSYWIDGEEKETAGVIGVGYEIDEENPEIITYRFVYQVEEIVLIQGNAVVNAGVLESMDIDGEISAVRSVPSYDDQGNSHWLYYDSMHTFEINYENGEFSVYYTEDEQEEVGGELVKQGELAFVVNAEGATFTVDTYDMEVELAFNVLENGVSFTMTMEDYDYNEEGERVLDAEDSSDILVALTMEEEGLQLAYDIEAWINSSRVVGEGAVLLQNMGK
jgi:hypothetical protein